MKTVGLPAADAAKVAELMTEADLTGADAHGVFRLPMYVKRMQKGGCNARPDIRVEKTAAATALVDGDNGMGHLVMARAAETAVELARDAGVAWVGTRHSNHAGAAGVYAAMTLPHDMVGIYGVVASANHMPIWGGVELLLGTNPVAVAIPAGEEAPVVLDIATSVVSYGTIKSHACRTSRCRKAGWSMPRTASRSPMRRAAARACCFRSAATRARACRSSSGCWQGRSTAQHSGATCSISIPTTPTSATPASS